MTSLHPPECPRCHQPQGRLRKPGDKPLGPESSSLVCDGCNAGWVGAQAEVALLALSKAVDHVLHRIQEDPDVYWVMGWGTESFHLLTLAESIATGESHEVVMERRQVDLQPAHRKREAEIPRLRRELEEMQG